MRRMGKKLKFLAQCPRVPYPKGKKRDPITATPLSVRPSVTRLYLMNRDSQIVAVHYYTLARRVSRGHASRLGARRIGGDCLTYAQGKPDCWCGDACRGDGSPRYTMNKREVHGVEPTLLSIRYSIPSLKARNALEPTLGLRVSMGGGEDRSHPRLPLKGFTHNDIFHLLYRCDLVLLSILPYNCEYDS
ncbi:hypothetical protein EVAR_90539_1 [Eumeta japonica]|uniref:Uncharacterized protein n=1 Tax=Eumeta variegata TaxID=151549 RepID=A0A4C1XZF8_EUMVA|nr:hypothetical protein EVAR_90539_1 [Eumeta japonica]